MTPVHDMQLRQGNSFRRRFRFRQFGGALINLAGSVVTLTIHRDREQPIRKTTADGSLTMTAPASGEVEIHLTAAETRELSVGVLRYEVERSILDERTSLHDEATLLVGSIVVERGVNDER